MAATNWNDLDTNLLIDKFILSDYEGFKKYVSVGEDLVKEALRHFPEAAYRTLRRTLFKYMLELREEVKPRLKVVVDTNIIVSEAFRVGNGTKSSTGRIFDSPIVELFSHRVIREEVVTQIHSDIPDGCSIEIAMSWAENLLTKIRLLDEIGAEFLERAKQKLNPEKFGNDFLFLGVAFESGAEKIISRDKRAFDNQIEPERWEMGRLAELVLVREGGYVSLFVAASSLTAVMKVSEYLFLVIANILKEIGAIIATIVNAVIKGSADILEKIPTWAWAIIAVVGISILAYELVDKKRRDEFLRKVDEFLEFVGEIVSYAFSFFKSVVEAIWNGIVSFLPLLIPTINALVIGLGVLMSFIKEILVDIEAGMKAIHTT